jgi:hypothetical protein
MKLYYLLDETDNQNVHVTAQNRTKCCTIYVSCFLRQNCHSAKVRSKCVVISEFCLTSCYATIAIYVVQYLNPIQAKEVNAIRCLPVLLRALLYEGSLSSPLCLLKNNM